MNLSHIKPGFTSKNYLYKHCYLSDWVVHR